MVSMTTTRTYRDRNTGLVERYPESVAQAFAYLELVADDAKPLAYLPIPDEAISAKSKKAGLIPDDKGDAPEEVKPRAR